MSLAKRSRIDFVCRTRAAGRGFTLVEMVLVLFIIVLLATLATPTFSMFLKSTRVQETARTVLSTCNKARAEAQRYRTIVAVLIGDDTGGLKTKPFAGDLPPRGQMEIWAIKLAYNDAVSQLSFTPYCVETPISTPKWYSYRAKEKLLSPEPIKFNADVRVLTGWFKHDSTTDLNYFYFPLYKNTGAWQAQAGEFKRHCTAYDKRGGACAYDQRNNMKYILVFDPTTGESLVIQAGVWQGSARPRILPFQLTHIQQPSGAVKLDQTSPTASLNYLVNNYPNAEAWSY